MTFTPSTERPLANILAAPLPRGLRQRTAGMSWAAVLATYGPSSGPLQLGAWACVGTGRPGARPGLQNRKFQATLAIGDRVCKSSVAAAGPVAALTEMLHEHGFAVELLSFHQLRQAPTPSPRCTAATGPAMNGRWVGTPIPASRRCGR